MNNTLTPLVHKHAEVTFTHTHTHTFTHTHTHIHTHLVDAVFIVDVFNKPSGVDLFF